VADNYEELNKSEIMNKQKKYHIVKTLALVILFLTTTLVAKGEDLRKIVNLEGYWKFSVGDMQGWYEKNFDDSDWDELRVPGKWEDQGYRDYNGYAWYRRKFRMNNINPDETIYLLLGRIDDVDEVYINGKKLAGMGNFPPDNYVTAYYIDRRYIIPSGYLNINGSNTIAIRVFDEYWDGGILSNPVGIYTDEDNQFLDYRISGQWKFHLGDNKQWKSVTYNDELWTLIDVPSSWEQQGFSDYDGYAWYRKEFTITSNIAKKDLYLSLGKVDDIDYVYLNGEFIGSVYDLKKDHEYKRKGYEYNARRVYKIPGGLLKPNGKNLIAVRVYDATMRGGIFEGPIGFMTEENYERYKRKHYGNRTIWDYLIDEYF
jgi:sialate O-acetylesterase